jgi:predicted alpha/beta hydrolase
MTDVHTLALQAADGYPLTATHYTAPSDQFIVLAGATAVPRGFYRKFAQFAQGHGIHVITTDYRGVGDSKQGTLKNFEMKYSDWSRYDLAAAVQYASTRGSVWLVGHSLGGHAIGQLPDPSVLRAAYVCGTGAGWYGWMPRPERYRAWLMWNLVGPITTRLYGYHPMSKFGMGEDLPMGVYRDWKRWCSYPRYFFDDPTAAGICEPFAHIRFPIAAAVSTDDLWAPPASRDAFFSGYTSAAITPVDWTAQALGVSQVGHMGYFRESVGRTLWPHMLQWLAQHGLQTG